MSLLRKCMPDLSAWVSQERRDLTSRERQIVILVGAGLSAPEVGRRLGISPHTVRNHLKNIYRKCDVHNRTEILLYAMRRRWLDSSGKPRRLWRGDRSA